MSGFWNRVLVVTLLVAVVGISGILASPRDHKDSNNDSVTNKKRATLYKIRSDIHENETQSKETPVPEPSASAIDAAVIIISQNVTGAKTEDKQVPVKNNNEGKIISNVNSTAVTDAKKESVPLGVLVVDTLHVKPLSQLSAASHSSHTHEENIKDDDPAPFPTEEGNKAELNVTAPATVEETAVSPPKPVSYMGRVKNMLRHLLELMGFVRQKRKSRKLTSVDSEDLGSDFGIASWGSYGNSVQYNDEVKATVGALLGRRDCYRRAFCGAGAFLHGVKGKEVLIVLMEKFVPQTWTDTVNHIKEAAIYNDPCNYECLDD